VTAQPTVLVRGKLQVVRQLLLEAAVAALLTVWVASLTDAGPLDYRFHASIIGAILVCLLPIVLVLFAVRLATLRRTSVVLSAEGIGTPGRGQVIAWSGLGQWRTVTRWRGRLIELTMRDGRRLLLAAPVGRPWRPDPAFDRDTALFEHWAARHGVTAAAPGHRSRRRAIVGLVAVSALVAVVGVRVATRGVIWPWTPTATHAATACVALEAAGLDRHWPLPSRTRDRDELDRHDLGEWSYCWWDSSTGHTDDAPYRRLTAAVKLHTAYSTFSPISMAARDFDSNRGTAVGSRPLAGVGDEAFAATSGDQVEVAGRRANVTVSVELWLNHGNETGAESAARQLVDTILAAVRLG